MPKVEGVSEDDRKAILDLLGRRARMLDEKIAPRICEALRQAPDLPAYEVRIKQRMGTNYRTLLNAALGRIRAGAERHGLTDPELAILYAYTTCGTWGFGPINRALRSGNPAQIARWHNYR